MSRRIITVLSCGALAIGGAFVAGCGDDNNDSGSAQTTTEAARARAATATTPVAKGATVEVSMKNSKFVPANITAKVGQKIHWTNDDPYAHNVTATKGEDFQSDIIDGGGTYDYTVDKAGTIDYVCTIHSGQTGTIRVTD
jgi:plastocyanin